MEQQAFENVWDALSNSPEEAANLTMRADLLIAIEKQIKGWKLTQVQAAQKLGLTQPRLSDLLRNKINNFSLDSLINIARLSGLDIQLQIAPRKQAA